GDAGKCVGAQHRAGRLADRQDVTHRVFSLCSLQDQMTLRSLRSAATSSATLSTLRPAARGGGSSTESWRVTGAAVTPRSASVLTSSGFFLACMMPLRDA